MVNEVLDAVVKALKDEFGHPVYTEDAPQRLDPPCFVITLITSNRTKQTHVTYRFSELYAVQYFPESKNDYRSELHEMIDSLQECLEIISVKWSDGEKPTMTENTDIAITEGVLTYTIRVEDVYFNNPDGDLMESIEAVGIEVNNG